MKPAAAAGGSRDTDRQATTSPTAQVHRGSAERARGRRRKMRGRGSCDAGAGDEKPRREGVVLQLPTSGRGGAAPKPPSFHGRRRCHAPRRATPLLVSPSSHDGIKVGSIINNLQEL